MFFESGPGFVASLRDLPKSLTLLTASHGFMGWVFSITGPLLILLSVAEQGKLSTAETVSWITIGYSVGGITSWILSLRYRQPLTAAVTIPGMVLVGTALNHMTYPEVIGAYLVTGLLLMLIALSGKINQVMKCFPLPIAMAMVAGVFLPFGVNIIAALAKDPRISFPTTMVFLMMPLLPSWTRTFPPILGAIVMGLLMAILTGQTRPELFELNFGRLSWIKPEWSLPAITELSIPLLLSVVAVHNTQGIMVLRIAGYNPPVNAMTWACGFGTMISATFGCAPICITGPVTAIISPPSAGPLQGRYAAGCVTGSLWLM
ncbi:MAG: benzoate transporter, partial [Deltaproteobacteria bacterium]|nr:benzoate transporter [Deltaproteobacteria bacterium]